MFGLPTHSTRSYSPLTDIPVSEIVPKSVFFERGWEIASIQHAPISADIPIVDSLLWKWHPADVPSDILTILNSKKYINNPLVGSNDLDCSWVEEYDWAFRCKFNLDPASFAFSEEYAIFLRGIDCWATLFINGERIGSTANQFREYRFSIEDELLVEGENELLIYIRSAKLVNAAYERANGVLPSGFDTPRVHARRCQCFTGWDWAARLSSAGVLSLPELVVEKPFRLENAFGYVKDLSAVLLGAATAEQVLVGATVEVVSARKGRGRLVAEIVDPDGRVLATVETILKISPGRFQTAVNFRLRDVRLWWPIGFGSQPMYNVRFLLSGDDRVGVSFSDSLQASFGMRTVSIVRRKEGDEESFTPNVNGHPIFCRGANWIPVSMLPGEVEDADYADLLSRAIAAGMNCLRIWGGGVYEREVFYDICNRTGVLVWQDFMFACAAYPDYREFSQEVEREADYQIKRLRNHPCVMLWCGNNENEWLHQIGELRKGDEKRIIGESLWRTLLKQRVEDLDPSRDYQQSSPFGRNPDDYNDEKSGDRHNWECWARWQSYDVYLRDRGRFISEFGFQALPSRETIDRFAPDATHLDSSQLLHHQKMILGQERITRYAAEMFRLPVEMDDWIECSQRLQAEILRRAVEHWRRRKFATAGALIWQYNDAYPGISWSLLDYWKNPKLSYQWSKRFFGPVLLSGSLEQDRIQVGAFPVVSEAAAVNDSISQVVSADFIAAAPEQVDKKFVLFTLVNDSPFALAGHVIIESCNSDGAAQLMGDVEIAADANANSDPVRLSLTELGISDIRGQFVRARFQPDEKSAEAIAVVQLMFADAAQAAAATRQLTPVEVTDFTAALHLDLLLVEPKFFKYHPNTRIFGMEPPPWYKHLPE